MLVALSLSGIYCFYRLNYATCLHAIYGYLLSVYLVPVAHSYNVIDPLDLEKSSKTFNCFDPA